MPGPQNVPKFDMQRQFPLKFGFSENATKFEKNLRCTFDRSFVFCARNSVLVKKSMKQMWSSRSIQTLTRIIEIFVGDFHSKI